MQIPPITRTQFLGGTMGLLSCFQFIFNHPSNEVANQPPATCVYHEPPPGIPDYDDNPSVFGKILRGELPCNPYQESAELLSFKDRSPKAKLHALVIPKRYVENVYSLTPTDDDVHLVQDMRQMGLEILEKEQPHALSTNDYILCYHIPPFNSVDHLHLHVLAPASAMNIVYRYGKYGCGSRWCIGDVEVIERLKRGQAAVPYKKIF
ncbi:hypothetical protein ACHAXR_013018 [Thalassiosira sp. AJA248-18]